MRGLQIFLLCLPVCVAAASRSVWDGAYTKEQSARGKTAYLEVCAKCHGETLSGGEGAPALVGKDFVKNWEWLHRG